jgi:xylulokinase
VAAGLGDTAASFLSCGATRSGICVDVAGTASVFAATVSAFAPDLSSRIMGCGRSAVPGLWHPYAYINGGGLNLNWFIEKVLGKADLAEGLAGLGKAIAGREPLETDPWFLPHMEGRVMPSDPGLRGAWAGVTRDHDAAHLYRSILEAVAFEYAVFRDAVSSLHPGLEFTELRATGGGASEPAWNEIKADVLGMGIAVIEGSGGAPRGAALVAATASGTLSDLAAAARVWARPGRIFSPHPERAGIYGRRRARYKQLLPSLSGFPG